MKKLGVVVVTVSQWKSLHKLINSFYDYSTYNHEFFIVPNFKKERSLAGAWNLGIKRAIQAGCDYIAVANDDCYLGDKDALPKILKEMEDNNLLICRTINDPLYESFRGYQFFIIRPEIVDAIGWFDEDFYPAYFEDDDHHYRISLYDKASTGRVTVNIPHQEAATVKAMSKTDKLKFRTQYETNFARYCRKWGGPPRQEKWDEPYKDLKTKRGSSSQFIGMGMGGFVDITTDERDKFLKNNFHRLPE